MLLPSTWHRLTMSHLGSILTTPSGFRWNLRARQTDTTRRETLSKVGYRHDVGQWKWYIIPLAMRAELNLAPPSASPTVRYNVSGKLCENNEILPQRWRIKSRTKPNSHSITFDEFFSFQLLFHGSRLLEGPINTLIMSFWLHQRK